jgi:hypothetical protein
VRSEAPRSEVDDASRGVDQDWVGVPLFDRACETAVGAQEPCTAATIRDIEARSTPRAMQVLRMRLKTLSVSSSRQQPLRHSRSAISRSAISAFPSSAPSAASSASASATTGVGPRPYRIMGLQGVEMVLLGYNTPLRPPIAPEQDNLADFHNHLVMAGTYQNGSWVAGVAKPGEEEGSCRSAAAPSSRPLARSWRRRRPSATSFQDVA